MALKEKSQQRQATTESTVNAASKLSITTVKIIAMGIFYLKRRGSSFPHPDHTFILCEAHQESISICGIVSTKDPALETAPSASINGSPKASSTEMASIAV